MSNNLKIPLYAQPDRNGNTYYVGRLQFPGNISCKDGISFVIFTAISGEEELQISEMTDKDKRK